MEYQLFCPRCKKKVRLNEEVLMDELNTITHKSCGCNGFEITDSGMFHMLIQKYDFFMELSK